MILLVVLVLGLDSCSDDGPEGAALPDSSTTVPTVTATPSAPVDPAVTELVVAFPDAASVDVWRNVDDSVMGGESASTSSWVAGGGSGAMEFLGELSTDNNGGFASTLSPVDSGLGRRASGSRALGLRASGDGRTYLLQLRAGASGADRWIGRFTPPIETPGVTGQVLELPIDSFEPVNQFLRPVRPSAALDPATITQIGVYVLDGQVGRFRLVLESISAIR